ncbi:MAG: UbiA family prenyltransferase [Verrucomicrobiia bacterium]|jgi:4-hydroxybenzoate polyprenyltransferase
MSNRWWVYQRERFPLLQHGPLIAAFSFSGVSYSALLRGPEAAPTTGAVVGAFVSSLLFFLQLRIADEFKDFEEDSRYRPYRPVPRGLVKLRELGWLFALAGIVQLAAGWWHAPRQVPVLLGVWLYLALMSKEFFVRDWLKARPITYMWTHMLIMPLIDFYATACDWAGSRGEPPPGLFWFLIVSFFNGMVIEIGRKIRAPGDEERGVETYSFLWGRHRAVAAWLGAMALTALCAWAAASRIRFVAPALGVLGGVWLASAFVCWQFLRQPQTPRAKRIELMAGVWTLSLYLMLGAVPLLARR